MDNKIKYTSIGLAFIGVVDSLYLTFVKYTGQYTLCGTIGDCASVNSSKYSEIGGVPIALLGTGAYLLILSLLLVENRSSFWREFAPVLVFGLTLVGVLYSIYLTYLEIAVLKAICPYCVLSAAILVVLFVLSSVRLWRGFSKPLPAS